MQKKTLHVSDSSSVHDQEFIHSTLSNGNVTQVCRQLSSRIRIELQFHPGPAVCTHCKISPHLSKIFTIYHNQYTINIKTS